MKVLFVCTGNICRSPMAEIIFRNICVTNGRNDIQVSGAGTFAEYEMTENAFKALEICGELLPSERLKATQFVMQMIDEYDHVICMTEKHADFVGRQYINVKTLHEFANCGDIFDPYGYPLDIYIEVCKKLQNALGLLYSKLFKE